MLHVSTNLMRTSCFQHTLHQGCIAIALQHTIVRHCRFANLRIWGEDCHTQTVFGVTSNIAFDATFVLNKVAPHQSIITAMSIMLKELLSKRRLCFWCLCHNQQSTRIFIYSMNQSHLRIVGIISRQIPQMPSNRMNQGTMEVAAPRMNHHSGRLIDDHQFIIFIAHIKGNILWFYRCIKMRAIQHQSDDIA